MSALSPRAFLHRLITAFVIAVVLSTVAIAGAYAEAARKVSKVATVPIDTSVLEPGGNFLLIGSDSRAFVNIADRGAALRQRAAADRSAIRHDHGRPHRRQDRHGVARLVPRDLWVAIPGIGTRRSTPRSTPVRSA